MSALKLRGYQQECLDAIDKSLETHTRVAAVLSTGLGKTVIFAHLIEREHRAGRRALVLVHREELAEQARAKIHSVAPHLTVGIVKAERNEVDADVIVASVQTLARPERREAIENIGIVIVDECHHAVARTWMEVLAHFGCFEYEIAEENEVAPEPEEATPCVGFTATLMRTDGKGLGDVWETVAYERDILFGIDNGYLTDVRGQAITVDGLDLATVARNRGDYQEGELGAAMESAGAGDVIAQAYLDHAWDGSHRDAIRPVNARQGVLFAPTVDTAHSFASSLRNHGIEAATIDGTMSSEDRALIYKRYEAGEIRVLSNCMVLTEGWDAPWAEVCVVARPTSSAALYTQMVGRVLRPWPGKDEALVLDVVGIAGRHKLQSLTDLVKTTVHEGESYAEARLRLEKEQATLGERDRIRGAVKAAEVELFANSHSSWLQTHKGTWFIPVTEGVFFLWPSGDGTTGTYDLGYMNSRKTGTRPNGWIWKNMTLEYGMAWAEQMANEDDPTISLKDRSWRRRKASEAQVAMGLRLKVGPVDEIINWRKGRLSDAISIMLASRQLDR